MATQSRRNTTTVDESLFERPARFEFFQAVRLLARRRRGQAAAGADDPDDDAVRFRSEVALRFPTADITKLVRAGEEESMPVMTVGFMGMATTGSFGSLPLTYVEEILEQEREKKTVLRDFFDLFNHRMISLFYSAWERHSLAAQYESGQKPYFERALFSLIGMGTPGLSRRLAIEDRALLARAGLLAQAPVSAPALESLLESYFDVPAEVRQFLSAWYDMDPQERNRLGDQNCGLGTDLFLGSSVRLCQFRFSVRLGPLDWDQYQDFFPDRPGFRALVDWIRLAVGPELDFEARLILREADVPPLRLQHTPSQACRLGWSTWLHSEPLGRDPDDASLEGDFDSSPAPIQFSTPTPSDGSPTASLGSMEVHP